MLMLPLQRVDVDECNVFRVTHRTIIPYLCTVVTRETPFHRRHAVDEGGEEEHSAFVLPTPFVTHNVAPWHTGVRRDELLASILRGHADFNASEPRHHPISLPPENHFPLSERTEEIIEVVSRARQSEIDLETAIMELAEDIANSDRGSE